MMARLPWPPPPDVKTSVCTVCSTDIFWQDAPTGGWWIHREHPDDDHDAKIGYGKAVLVVEVDPARIADAVGDFQRFAFGELQDRTLFGPTLHVAVEEKAEAVLEVFKESPVIDDSELFEAQS
jgi:hypothetical protein